MNSSPGQCGFWGRGEFVNSGVGEVWKAGASVSVAGKARAQGGQDAAGAEGVVGFFAGGESDVEVAEGEGEGQCGLADAADADQRDGGGRGGVEQVGTQEAQLVFAADEAVLRPAEVAAPGAVEGKAAQALGDVLGEPESQPPDETDPIRPTKILRSYQIRLHAPRGLGWNALASVWRMIPRIVPAPFG